MVAHIILVAKDYPDPRTMGPYGQGVEATMARYGGGYQSVLRHRITTLEGDWHPPKGSPFWSSPATSKPWPGITPRSTPCCLSCAKDRALRCDPGRWGQ